AAAVLLVAAGASFLFFKGLAENGRQGGVARKTPVTPKPGNNNGSPDSIDKGIAKKPTEERKPTEEPRRNTGTTVVQEPEKKPDPEKPPVQPEKPEPGPIYTAPRMEQFNPHQAEVSLPTLLNLRDLAQEQPRQTLIRELARHDGFYVEV